MHMPLIHGLFSFKIYLLLLSWFLFPITQAFSSQKTLSLLDSDPYASNLESARFNAKLIFNSIHSSVRQWGSSYHHNGLSLMIATVPAGTLLYHGREDAEVPVGMEWLAFEIEHSEFFARIWPDDSAQSDRVKDDSSSQSPEISRKLNYLGSRNQARMSRSRDEEPLWRPGYLKTFQTNRSLKLLYFDGMAGSKSRLGTLDTQDVLIRNVSWKKTGQFDDVRSADLCQFATELGFHGILRLEAGLEIIKCNFSDGLDHVFSHKRPEENVPEGIHDEHYLEYLQAVASRNDGIDANRISVDYSSMIHMGFYATNLTNPDPSFFHLPRFITSDSAQRARIISDFKDVAAKGQTSHGVDWQGVVDMILKRYSGRLNFMATPRPVNMFISRLNVLLNSYINYEAFSAEESMIECVSHYLRPVQMTSKQDELIYAAVEAVMQRICKTLFDVREVLLAQRKNMKGDDDDVDTTKSTEAIQALIEWLDWSDSKRCKTVCAYNEICFIAVWPFGRIADHANPQCRDDKYISSTIVDLRDNYWGLGELGEFAYEH